MTLEGIDVSNWQGRINWLAVRNAGKAFAAVKATQGLRYEDPTFPVNWSGMAQVGITRIAYHFLNASLDGAAQADFLHGYVRGNGHFVAGDLVLLDLEEASIAGQTPEAVVNCAAAFVGRARAQVNKGVCLYTNPDTWLSLLGNPTDPELAQCPLWLADYGFSVPALANWPHGLSFWQYSSSGHCPGVAGQVDLDRFYGTPMQLQELSSI